MKHEISKIKRFISNIKRDRQLLLLFLPVLIFFIIFRYGPIYFLIIAFKHYMPAKGVFGSPWVGLENFSKFFAGTDFWMLFKNTMLLGGYTLLWTFPFPIVLAIFLNEIRNNKFKKLIQTASFLPSFLSLVVISGMVIDFLSPERGLINNIIKMLGGSGIYFMTDPKWFRTIYIATEIWTNTGYTAIVFLAAIISIDQSFYEASEIDGCSRFKKIRYITLPSIMPTIMIMFILRAGSCFRVGYEKVLLLYNPSTYSVADVFQTYVYRKGIVNFDYSYATAVGLFEATVALGMLFITDRISKKLSNQSLW